MATHKCLLKLVNKKVVPEWSRNAKKMQVGDTVRFTSGYGRVRLDFQEDCPFLPEKLPGGTVAFFLDSEATLGLKLKRLGRNKTYNFICTSDAGPVKGWPDNGGGQIPPQDPPPTT